MSTKQQRLQNFVDGVIGEIITHSTPHLEPTLADARTPDETRTMNELIRAMNAEKAKLYRDILGIEPDPLTCAGFLDELPEPEAH